MKSVVNYLDALVRHHQTAALFTGIAAIAIVILAVAFSGRRRER